MKTVTEPSHPGYKSPDWVETLQRLKTDPIVDWDSLNNTDDE